MTATSDDSGTRAVRALKRLVAAIDQTERCASSPDGECVHRCDAFTGTHVVELERSIAAAKAVLRGAEAAPRSN